MNNKISIIQPEFKTTRDAYNTGIFSIVTSIIIIVCYCLAYLLWGSNYDIGIPALIIGTIAAISGAFTYIHIISKRIIKFGIVHLIAAIFIAVLTTFLFALVIFLFIQLFIKVVVWGLIILGFVIVFRFF